MDDICTIADTSDGALNRLDEKLSRLEKNCLKLEASKCILLQKSINKLGHTFDSFGIRPTEENLKAVKEWPVPQNWTNLRSFLGFCGYYIRFIRGYSGMAAPLNRWMPVKRLFGDKNKMLHLCF